MAKTHAFISFDFDNDKVLKDFIIGQSKHEDSPSTSLTIRLKKPHPKRIGRKKRAKQ